jgi:hypothetical protein
MEHDTNHNLQTLNAMEVTEEYEVVYKVMSLHRTTCTIRAVFGMR